MILPYITKFQYSNCSKWHRLGFKQWWKIVKEASDYVQIQKESSNLDIAMNRAEEFKGYKFDKRNTWYNRVAKWLMK